MVKFKWVSSISRWLIFIQWFRAPGPFHLVAPRFSTHHFHCHHALLHRGFSKGVSKPVSDACYFNSPSLDISSCKACWEMKSSCVSRRKREQLGGPLASFCLGFQGLWEPILAKNGGKDVLVRWKVCVNVLRQERAWHVWGAEIKIRCLIKISMVSKGWSNIPWESGEEMGRHQVRRGVWDLEYFHCDQISITSILTIFQCAVQWH